MQYIILRPDEIKVKEKQLIKLKCEKLILQSKYFKLAKEELVNTDIVNRRFEKNNR